MTIELITRLNPKIQSYTLGRGGVTELTWETISSAIAGLPRQYSVLVNLLRGASYPSEIAEFKKWLSSLMLQKILQNKDKSRKKITEIEIAQGLANIAIYSYLQPRIHCSICHGTGRALLSNSNKKTNGCESCLGKGFMIYSYQAKLNMAGWLRNYSNAGPVQVVMSVEAYRKKWVDYERYASSILNTMEMEIAEWIAVSLGLIDAQQIGFSTLSEYRKHTLLTLIRF